MWCQNRKKEFKAWFSKVLQVSHNASWVEAVDMQVFNGSEGATFVEDLLDGKVRLHSVRVPGCVLSLHAPMPATQVKLELATDDGADDELVQCDDAAMDFDVRNVVNGCDTQDAERAELRSKWELFVLALVDDSFLFPSLESEGLLSGFTSVCSSQIVLLSRISI